MYIFGLMGLVALFLAIAVVLMLFGAVSPRPARFERGARLNQWQEAENGKKGVEMRRRGWLW